MKIKKILVFSVVFVLFLCAFFIPAHAASYNVVVTNGTTIHESFNNFVYGNTWKEFCEYIHTFSYNDDNVFYKGHKVMFNGEYVNVSDSLQSATYTLVECEHSFTEWVVDIEATCEEDGSKFRYCIYCETEQVMVIPAHGHAKKEYKVIEPTCTEPGESYYSCLYMCGAKLELETTPATGHNLQLASVTSATCTTDGLHVYSCSICKYTKTDVISAYGHNYEELRVESVPTCQSSGINRYYCHCGEYKTELIEPISHNFIETVGQQPTCTEHGYNDWTCSYGCGSQSDSIVIPALGHTSSNETIIKEATCTENGEKTGVCERCGESYTSTIPRTGHTYSEATCTEAPTCHCGATWGAPLGHYLLEADCELPVRCSRCDYTEGEALGHDFDWGSCKRCDLFDPFYWIGDTNDPSEDDPITDFIDRVFNGVNDGISTMNKNLDELLSTILGFCFIFVVIWGVPKIYRKIKSARKSKYHNNYNYYRRK